MEINITRKKAKRKIIIIMQLSGPGSQIAIDLIDGGARGDEADAEAEAEKENNGENAWLRWQMQLRNSDE